MLVVGRERLALLVSGGGTTMEQVIKACQSGEIPMDVSVVVSSDPQAGAIQKAKDLGVRVDVVDPKDFCDKDGKVNPDWFGQKIYRKTNQMRTTVVFQAGWLPKTPDNFIWYYQDRIFNQHPGPQKETKGTHGVQPHAVMLYIARQTGRNLGTDVITHRVTSKFDEGPLVAMEHVEIIDSGEDPKSLQARALPIEHQLQIEFLKGLARGDVKEIAPNNEYIKPGEEYILFEARKQAREKYRNG